MTMKMRERRTMVAWRKERMREKRSSTVEKATGLPKEKGVEKIAGGGVEGVDVAGVIGGLAGEAGGEAVAIPPGTC